MTMKRIPSVNGLAWGWTHSGWQYQATWLPGSNAVRLWYQQPNGQWEIGHTRPLEGRVPVLVAQELYDHVTSQDVNGKD